MLTGSQVRQKYLDFFAKRGHAVIPSSPLVPENDPTTLFTGSGMQPMLPYLLGQDHPLGTRLVDSQKCFRGQDMEEVGDNRHDTFFEMLGNWSLGDYFKKEQLTWIFEFFTKELGLPVDRLHVSVFEGNDQIPKDEEAAQIWQGLGIPENHIYYYGVKKNWWNRGEIFAMPVGEPGGPDSEVFYDFGAELKLHESSQWKDEVCHPNCDCGRFMEIGNNVFMTYKKTPNGFEELTQKNIDFGGGFERIVASVNNNPDIFTTDLYTPIIKMIEEFTNQKYVDPNKSSMRIIADHLKASIFLISDGVLPSNKAQGYFLRRLIRRSLVKLQQLAGDVMTQVDEKFYQEIVETVFRMYANVYFHKADQQHVISTLSQESGKFSKTLRDGLKKASTVSPFDLFQTYGFPIEVTEELYLQQGKKLDREEFDRQLKAHQDLSRTAGAGMFKGGLVDQSEITTKYHTATHLLHKALRDTLGDHVQQKGSNITADRLRFDFSHSEKLTPDQLVQIESLINQKIQESIPVIRVEMPKTQALVEGAMAFFPEKYPDIASVYSIGSYSKELCGGPHVTNTSEIGKIKITKEESAGSGIRRIYAELLPSP